MYLCSSHPSFSLWSPSTFLSLNSLRHIYDGDVLYILRSKFLLSSMYYAAHSVLTFFSALSFPRSLCLFSPPASLYVLWCVIFIYLFLLYTTASLHSRAFAKMSKVPAYLRYIFVALLSRQEDTNKKICISSLEFPVHLYLLSSCIPQELHNNIWITPQIFQKDIFSLNRVHTVGRMEDVIDSCTAWN